MKTFAHVCSNWYMEFYIVIKLYCYWTVCRNLFRLIFQKNILEFRSLILKYLEFIVTTNSVIVETILTELYFKATHVVLVSRCFFSTVWNPTSLAYTFCIICDFRDTNVMLDNVNSKETLLYGILWQLVDDCWVLIVEWLKWIEIYYFCNCNIGTFVIK